MNAQQLTGTWTLISFVAQSQCGESFRPWGDNPRGQLMYSDGRQMAVVMSQAGRPKFVSPGPFGGTSEEVRAAFENLEAYAGTFEVNEVEGLVTHYTEVCRIPNWEGGKQVRNFKVEDGILLLSTPPVRVDGKDWTFTFGWKRKN